VSEPSNMKPNLVDQTCELLKYDCATIESYTIPLLRALLATFPLL